MKMILVTVLVILIGLACPTLAMDPKAESIARGYADAQASSNLDKDPFAVTWTTTSIYDNAKIDPLAISNSAGYALAAVDCTSFANSFSSAFAYSQGPNLAQTKTWTENHATASDFSASASSTSHAEGTAN